MATAVTSQAAQAQCFPCNWISSACRALRDLVAKVINAIRNCFGGSQPQTATIPTLGNGGVPQTAAISTGPTLPNSRATVASPLNLIAFYRGTEPNNNGVTLNQILAWDDTQLESVHNYIQWLFPLRMPSSANPTAPILDDAPTIHAFRSDPALKNQMLRSFRRMLAFYGLQMNEATKVITRAPNFPDRARVWLYCPPGHHNFLRISRILRSMCLINLGDYSRSFLHIMQDIQNNEGQNLISHQTFRYWQTACP